MDLINFISGTPLPNVLVVGGLLFIALALGSQIGGKIEMPAERQRLSGILGASLLLAGLVFYIIPALTSLADGSPSSSSAQSPNSTASSFGSGDACLETYFAGISNDRIATLESGADSQIVINTAQSKDEPFALQFTNNRQAVGGLIANFFLDSKLYKIVSVVDAECNLVTSYKNITNGGDPNTLQNWDQLELRLSENLYLLRFDYSDGEIKIDFELIVE
jgi:hypothetical protein